MSKQYTLTEADLLNARDALRANDRIREQYVRTTRTSLHPEKRSAMPFELALIENQLLAGYVLVVPAPHHDALIPELRELGFFEEALANIFRSEYLPTAT